MKVIFLVRFVFILIVGFSFGSWTPKSIKSIQLSNTDCTMDLFVQNNTGVAVEFVKFESSLQTSTFSNLAPNGGTGTGGTTLDWVIQEGFALSVKMSAYPGTGSIRVFREYTQVACRNFTNNSSSTTYVFWEDFSDNSCPAAYMVYIETSNCP